MVAKVSKFKPSMNIALNSYSIITFVISLALSKTTSTTAFLAHFSTVFWAVGELFLDIQESRIPLTCSSLEKKFNHLHPRKN